MYANETLKKYRLMMVKKVADMLTRVNDLHVSISNGNRKIGRVMNVSTPAILACKNCSGCAHYCYDIKANFVYINTVLPARAKNLAILTADRERFFREIDEKMNRRKKNKFFRWHVSGDIIDFDYFSRMVENARNHPNFIIWTYTKNYAVVNAYVAENGKDSIPSNFHIMFSEWDGMELVNPYDFPIFTCKLKDGNKNHKPEFFNSLFKCPGNCDICKEHGTGCIGGMDTYADEH